VVTDPNRLAYRPDCIGLVGALGVASLPGHIPKMGEMALLATLCSQLVFTTSFRVLFFYIQDTFLGCFKIVPLRY
jgi:hypothetical protein